MPDRDPACSCSRLRTVHLELLATAPSVHRDLRFPQPIALQDQAKLHHLPGTSSSKLQESTPCPPPKAAQFAANSPRQSPLRLTDRTAQQNPPPHTPLPGLLQYGIGKEDQPALPSENKLPPPQSRDCMHRLRNLQSPLLSNSSSQE